MKIHQKQFDCVFPQNLIIVPQKIFEESFIVRIQMDLKSIEHSEIYIELQSDFQLLREVFRQLMLV